MASSGQLTLSTQSVDYGGGRGAVTLTNIIGWAVDNSGNISFQLISTTDNAGGTWGICYSNNQYYVRMVPQVSYDNGTSWTNLASANHLVISQCTNPPVISQYTNTVAMSETLINSLGSYHLSGNCKLRFLYYMDPAPAPSASNPNAFPDSSYSEAVQVPVVVTVDYRPGEVLTGGSWKSTNRSGGKCQLLLAGSWVTMTTSDAGSTGNPPSIRNNNTWKNQALIGDQT